jgi:predicted chitinase
MLTAEQLQAIMPRLSKTSCQLLPFLQAAMAEFAIQSPARAAAFLAQIAHESGQLEFMEELWGPTAAQRRYEPVTALATALGNTVPGDGKRFKGRGPIQVTGRANYQRFGDLLAIDLLADPSRAAMPEVGFRIAGLFWSRKGLNELADLPTAGAFREITRRINGGLHGLAERRRFYQTACRVFGVTVGTGERRARARGPGLADEPSFERGAEAIRAHAPRPRRRRRTSPADRRRPRNGNRPARRRS